MHRPAYNGPSPDYQDKPRCPVPGPQPCGGASQPPPTGFHDRPTNSPGNSWPRHFSDPFLKRLETDQPPYQNATGDPPPFRVGSAFEHHWGRVKRRATELPAPFPASPDPDNSFREIEGHWRYPGRSLWLSRDI